MLRNKYFDLFRLGIFIIYQPSFSQVPLINSNNVDKIDSIYHEHIFIQTDRNIYFPGDTVWFSGWIRNKSSGSIENLSNGLYTIIVDEKKTIIDSTFNRIINGKTEGFLNLPYTMMPGFYSIRSWTTLMQDIYPSKEFNFTFQVVNESSVKFDLVLQGFKDYYINGDTSELRLKLLRNGNNLAINQKFLYRIRKNEIVYETNFSKTNFKGEATIFIPITLEDLYTPLTLQVQIKDQDSLSYTLSKRISFPADSLCIEILPEGGNFINGTDNIVGICSVDNIGNPKPINGIIIDNEGNNYGKFSTDKNGTASFHFVPYTNLKYYLITQGIIEKKNTYKYKFPDSQKEGVIMQASKPSRDSISVLIIMKGTEYLNGQLCLILNGEIRLRISVPKDQNKAIFKIPTNTLPHGIASIVYFKENNIPVAERSIEINRPLYSNLRLNVEKISSNKNYDEYYLHIQKSGADQIPTILTISIVDSLLGFNRNLYIPDIIETFLFYDKIPIFLPTKILINGFNNLSEEELDRILLTYFWKHYQIPENYLANRKNKKINTFDFFQIALNKFNNPANTGELIAVANFENGYARIFSCDSSGLVNIPLSELPSNTDYLLVQPKHKILSISKAEIPFSISFKNSVITKPIITSLLFENILVNDKNTYLETFKTTKLPEVKVIASKSIKYNNWFEKNYTPFGRVSVLNTKETPIALSVRDLINRMFILKKPLYVVDDFQVPTDVDPFIYLESYGVSAIQSITYLRGPQGFTFYGQAAINGVVFITTKADFRNKSPSNTMEDKILVKYYQLFSYFRKFNNFSLFNGQITSNPEIPYNPTFYWNSDCLVDKEGMSTIHFFSRPQCKTVIVSINGADIKGNLVSTRSILHLQ